MGVARTSKLLAAKRPALVPIRDEAVSTLLGNPPDWWTHFQQALADESLRGRIEKIGEPWQQSNGLTPLRTVDVILWMIATEWWTSTPT